MAALQALLLVACLAVPIAWDGGFDAASQWTFAGLAAGAVLAGSFLAATVERQSHRRRVTRFAHDLPLELGVELGLLGLALGIALYAAAGKALGLARGSPALWLAGPAVVAFLVANLVDWPWHVAGAGAVFALALGSLLPAPRVAT